MTDGVCPPPGVIGWPRTNGVTARAAWDARGEDVSALAARLVQQLEVYDDLLGDGSGWTFVDDDSTVSADVAALAAAIGARVSRDSSGIAFPTHGYVCSVARESAAGFLAIRLRTGSSMTGKRRPSNVVQVTMAGPLRNGTRDLVRSDLVVGVLRGLVTAWAPDSAAVYDDDGAIAAQGRGGFAPVVGQRTWVSDRIGSIVSGTPLVRTHRADGGSYLDAADTLDSRSAVLEVWSALQANGVTGSRQAPGVPSTT